MSWVTVDERGSDTVLYWSDNATEKLKAKGTVTKYKYFNYTSGYIHHATIKHLQVNFLSFLVILFFWVQAVFHFVFKYYYIIG